MNDFAFDLNLILNVLEISSNDLARETGIKPASISNWLNGKLEPDLRSKEDIYEFAFENGLLLNESFEEPYMKLCRNNNMQLLFHGAKHGLDNNPDLNHSKQFNDFGKGFYCGETYRQPLMYVSGYSDSVVYSFGLKTKGLNIAEYDIDQNWALTIAYFRGSLKEFEKSKKLKEILNKCKNADVIIAPIADNRMFDIIDEFIEGRISDEACCYGLASLNLGKQYVLKSKKALKNLGLLREFYVCNKEKKYCLEEAEKLRKTKMKEIRNFRSEHRNGRYIEEILYE